MEAEAAKVEGVKLYEERGRFPSGEQVKNVFDGGEAINMGMIDFMNASGLMVSYCLLARNGSCLRQQGSNLLSVEKIPPTVEIKTVLSILCVKLSGP
jgi:hypothetical protein